MLRDREDLPFDELQEPLRKDHMIPRGLGSLPEHHRTHAPVSHVGIGEGDDLLPEDIVRTDCVAYLAEQSTTRLRIRGRDLEHAVLSSAGRSGPRTNRIDGVPRSTTK